MEKNSKKNVRLGVFVSVTIALFIVGIYFIGERQQLFNSTFRISGIFYDISGLQVGNNVRFSGINVGVIEGINQITDSTVKVDMVIEESTRKFLKKDAVAIIGTDGLMGSKIILIIPGSNSKVTLGNNGIIETTEAVNMDEILLSLKITTENAAHITRDLAIIMENIRAGRGTIGKLLMDSILAQNVDHALVNIKQGAGGFKENMDAAGHTFLLKGYLKKKEDAKNKKNK